MKIHMQNHGWQVHKKVRKEWRGLRQKGVILHRVFMFKIPLILFMNDRACWSCNTNSISGLFLVYNKGRVQNGRTQDNIQRNTWVQRQRLKKRMHMRTRRTQNQIFMKIEWSDVGRVWRMNKCVSMIVNITRQWPSCWIRLKNEHHSEKRITKQTSCRHGSVLYAPQQLL